MKKILALTIALIAVLTACFGITGCGEKTVEPGAKIIVGITDYKPMDYKDENGKWIGFDAELSEKVFTSLGYTIEFKEIDWDTKIVTLTAGNIDCIWNGMTVTDDLLNNLLLSNVYLENQQYGVVKVENASAYTNIASLNGKKVAVESGSAAEGALKDKECELRKLPNQNSAIMEVSAGTADIAVVDFTMAKTLTAEGSDYFGKLTMVDLGFEKEEFAIAFRKSDSKLCWNVNKKINELKKDGTIKALAEKYNIENLLVD